MFPITKARRRTQNKPTGLWFVKGVRGAMSVKPEGAPLSYNRVAGTIPSPKGIVLDVEELLFGVKLAITPTLVIT